MSVIKQGAGHRRWLMIPLMGLMLALLMTLWTPTVQAQDTETKLKQLYSQGLEQYDFFEYTEAGKLLDEALKLAKESKIRTPIVARLYFARGILNFAIFKDEDEDFAISKVRTNFMMAVSIDPAIILDENYSTPKLEEILAEAKKLAGGSGDTGNTGGNSSSKGGEPSITHKALSIATGGKPFKIRAMVPAHPDVFRVRARYRFPDQGEFQSIELQPTPTDPDVFMGTIPAEKLTGATFFYYIEILDRAQVLRTSSGTPAKPHKVSVMGGRVAPIPKGDVPLMGIFLGSGIGVGLASGDSLNCANTPNCHGGDPTRLEGVAAGLARTSAFVHADAMFFLNKELELGAYVRFQFEPNTEAVMGGIKLRYFLLSTEPHRVYSGFALGGGYVRYLVNLGESFNNFTDVVEKGPIHLAPNFGYMLSLNENIGLQFDLMIPIHFPDFTFHIDFTAGPYFQF